MLAGAGVVYSPGIPDSCGALVQDHFCSAGCISHRWADPPLEAGDGDGDGGVTCLLWLSLCMLRDLLRNSMMATVRPSPCSSLGAGKVKLGSQCLGHNPQAAAEVVGSPPPSVSSRYWFCLLDLVAATGKGDLDALLGF